MTKRPDAANLALAASAPPAPVDPLASQRATPKAEEGLPDRDRGPSTATAPPAADPYFRGELVAALGAQAAVITNAMDRWFDHVLAQLEDVTSRIGAAQTSGSKTAADPNQADPNQADPNPENDDAAAAALPPTPPTAAPQALCGTPIARFRRRDDWEGWSYHQAAALRPGGVVEIRQDRSTPGIISAPIATAEGGLFRVLVEAEIAAGATRCRPHVRLVGEGDTPLGPDIPFGDGRTESFIFAPLRTRELKLYLIVWHPEIGYRFKLNAVVVEKIDIDAYHAHSAARRERGTIASLATIPSRCQMLPDCVASLLLQCDKVRVFLNGYPDVPAELDHPRIEIRRSQDWDDKGDAGKFGWLDAEDKEEEGYRIIVDDDLIFPVDFVDKMTAAVARHENRAIAGVHGILLKQPVTEYYDPEARSVFFFQAPLTRERTVHVLGTNALCYHTSAVRMRWAEFMFRNMADIFLARYAQQHGLPMVAVERPHHWVRQNTQEGGFDTIYEHSLKQTRSRFDSSLVQDAVVKWMMPLTLQPSLRPKLVLAIIANSIADFELTFASWHKTRWLDFDWVVMATAGVEDDVLRRHLTQWKTDHEIHVIDPAGATAFERIDQLLALASQIGFRAAVVVSGRVECLGGTWTKPVLGLIDNPAPRALTVGSMAGTPGTVWHGAAPEGAVPAVVIINPVATAEIGGLDRGIDQPGLALVDWMIRAAAVSQSGPVPDGIAKAVGESLRIDPSPPAEGRVDISRRALTGAGPIRVEREIASGPRFSVNEVFERVLTINLDRRADRWNEVRRRFGQYGIETERFRAVDGAAPEILAEYEAYKRQPLVQLPHGVRPIASSREFYQDYDSQTARVAYAENQTGAKAILSPGAWGYLKTWEAILEQALRERPETLLVFDDDVVLHRRTHQVFAAAVGGLPDDWLVLQLGSLQYHWEKDWVSWRTPFLYSTNGSAVGSHAVGLHFEIVPFLLDHVKRMELPFDTGALAAATYAFKDRCFVAYPNIAIQSLADSDIGTSDFQEASTSTDIARTYRWNADDYVADPGFRLIDKTADAPAPVARILLNG